MSAYCLDLDQGLLPMGPALRQGDGGQEWAQGSTDGAELGDRPTRTFARGSRRLFTVRLPPSAAMVRLPREGSRRGPSSPRYTTPQTPRPPALPQLRGFGVSRLRVASPCRPPAPTRSDDRYGDAAGIQAVIAAVTSRGSGSGRSSSIFVVALMSATSSFRSGPRGTSPRHRAAFLVRDRDGRRREPRRIH